MVGGNYLYRALSYLPYVLFMGLRGAKRWGKVSKSSKGREPQKREETFFMGVLIYPMNLLFL